jgi:hypothetical protein
MLFTKEIHMIKLGSRVRDIVTGFEGIATSRTEWLHGCARIGIQPETLDKDGKVIDASVFDEQQVEIVKEMAPRVAKHVVSTPPGGPRKDPGRTNNPDRGRTAVKRR